MEPSGIGEREFYREFSKKFLAARLRESGGSVRREKGTVPKREPRRRGKITALDLARQRSLFDDA